MSPALFSHDGCVYIPGAASFDQRGVPPGGNAAYDSRIVSLSVTSDSCSM